MKKAQANRLSRVFVSPLGMRISFAYVPPFRRTRVTWALGTDARSRCLCVSIVVFTINIWNITRTICFENLNDLWGL